MKQRKVLFGYCYAEGRIVVEPRESDIFKEMCDSYCSEKSLMEIAGSLNSRGIEYMPDVCSWNKSRIMRLLADKRYLGTKQYPALINQATYDTIQRIRKSKNTQIAVKRNEGIFQLRVPVCCQKCNGKMRRRRDDRYRVAIKWVCTNSRCGISVGKEDDSLLQDIIDFMNDMIQNPNRICIEDKEMYSGDEVRKLNVEVAEMLKAPEIDREKAKKKLLGYVSKQYEKIDSAQCQGRKMKDIFLQTKPLVKMDGSLLWETVNRIQLYADGTIGFVLENKQEIRQGKNYGTR